LQTSVSVSTSFFGRADVATLHLSFWTSFRLPSRSCDVIVDAASRTRCRARASAGDRACRLSSEPSAVAVQPAGSVNPTHADTWNVQEPSHAVGRRASSVCW
jgi:hypothetical protein